MAEEEPEWGTTQNLVMCLSTFFVLVFIIIISIIKDKDWYFIHPNLVCIMIGILSTLVGMIFLGPEFVYSNEIAGPENLQSILSILSALSAPVFLSECAE